MTIPLLPNITRNGNNPCSPTKNTILHGVCSTLLNIVAAFVHLAHLCRPNSSITTLTNINLCLKSTSSVTILHSPTLRHPTLLFIVLCSSQSTTPSHILYPNWEFVWLFHWHVFLHLDQFVNLKRQKYENGFVWRFTWVGCLLKKLHWQFWAMVWCNNCIT